MAQDVWVGCSIRLQKCLSGLHDIMQLVGVREKWIKWSHHLVIWSRNHEYSIFSGKDL